MKLGGRCQRALPLPLPLQTATYCSRSLARRSEACDGGRVAASHNLQEGSMTHDRIGIGQVGWLSQAARM